MVLDQIHTHIQELSWTPTLNNTQKFVKMNQRSKYKCYILYIIKIL